MLGSDSPLSVAQNVEDDVDVKPDISSFLPSAKPTIAAAGGPSSGAAPDSPPQLVSKLVSNLCDLGKALRKAECDLEDERQRVGELDTRVADLSSTILELESLVCSGRGFSVPPPIASANALPRPSSPSPSTLSSILLDNDMPTPPSDHLKWRIQEIYSRNLLPEDLPLLSPSWASRPRSSYGDLSTDPGPIAFFLSEFHAFSAFSSAFTTYLELYAAGLPTEGDVQSQFRRAARGFLRELLKTSEEFAWPRVARYFLVRGRSLMLGDPVSCKAWGRRDHDGWEAIIVKGLFEELDS